MGSQFIENSPGVAHSLHRACHLYGPQTLFGVVDSEGQYQWTTYDDALCLAYRLACNLRQRCGLERRSTVAICADNRPEWLLTDFACAFNDFLSVGIHSSWPVTEIVHVLRNSEARCLVCDDPVLLRAVLEAHGPGLQTVLIGEEHFGEGSPTWSDLTGPVPASNPGTYTGAGGVDLVGDVWEVECEVEDPTEPFTLAYTSGTSGVPKGVAVSKKRWKKDALAGGFKGHTNPTVASYMALAHGGDRGICWQAVFAGARIGFVSTRCTHEQRLDLIGMIRPTFFLAMSHFWAGLYTEYCAMLADRVVERLRTLCPGMLDPDFVTTAQGFHPEAWGEFIQEMGDKWNITRTVQRHFNERLGGCVFLPVTGGGHTSDAVIQWMGKVFMPPTTTGEEQESRVRNSYGSTEFPGISSNGDISADVDLELVDVPHPSGAGDTLYSPKDLPYPRGEIRVKARDAAGVSVQYWKNPTATDAVVRDGWYHTGDVGLLLTDDLDENRRPKLQIIDRTAKLTELYVDGRSVWVEQSKLETLYAQCPLVHRISLQADRNESRVVAIIVPPTGQPTPNPQDLLTAFRAIGTAAGLPEHEVPLGVHLAVDIPWTASSGLLSAVGKVNPAIVRKRYQREIEQIYATTKQESSPPIKPSLDLPAVRSKLDAVRQETTRRQAVDRGETQVPQTIGGKPISKATRDDDFLEFSFAGPSPVAADEMNGFLEQLKPAVRLIRAKSDEWDAGLKALRSKVEAAQKSTGDTMRRQTIDKLESMILSSDDVDGLVRGVLRVLTAHRGSMLREYHNSELSLSAWGGKTKEQYDTLVVYQRVMEQLEDCGKRWGIRVPYQIAYHQWWNTPGVIPDDDEAVPASLRQSLGDAFVWCTVFGDRIERDADDIGTPRYHCLDATGVDCGMDAWDLLGKIFKAAGVVDSNPNPAAKALRRAFPYHPVGEGESSHLWVVERSHYWHLRNSVDRPLTRQEHGGWDRIDTPSGCLVRAMAAYADRPALGIPRPDGGAFSEGHVGQRFTRSSLVDSLGLTVLQHDGFAWLTYRQCGELTDSVARGLRGLEGVSRGSTVAISGYNSFEVAVSDFGSARAGIVSVGLHTTSDGPSAAHVLSHAAVTVLLCTVDVLFQPTHKGAEGSGFQSWSLQSVWSSVIASTLRHVVVLDSDVATVQARGFADTFPGVHLTSLADLVRAEPRGDVAIVENADDQPEGGPEGVITILYTSGSSGRPKGVTITAGAFYRDIAERVFVEPHITVSYIPLSHSSDRMKLWEFLMNGGRVAFVYYAADNWLDHETTKKTEDIVSFGRGTNNVPDLMRQVRRVAPTAMACPPRIWNGLYALWREAAAAEGWSGEGTPPPHAVAVADRFILDMLGPRVKTVITGGAPTPEVVEQWVRRVLPYGIAFNDSYGTTEGGAVTSDGYPIDTKGVEVRLGPVPALNVVGGMGLSAQGEVLVTSPNVSHGYYKDEKLTAEFFFEDGVDDLTGQPKRWFRTGDLGERVLVTRRGKERYSVLGRINAAMGTSGGAVVFPGRLEALFSTSRWVHQVYVHAQSDSPVVVAVVVPTPALQSHVGSTPEETVLEDFRRIAVECAVKDTRLVPAAVSLQSEEWTVHNGMLNGSQKLVRGRVAEVFRDVLTRLHQRE